MFEIQSAISASAVAPVFPEYDRPGNSSPGLRLRSLAVLAALSGAGIRQTANEVVSVDPPR